MSEEIRPAPRPDAVATQVVERRVIERRGAGVFRQFLLFLAGLLIGANGVYYWMQRDATRRAATASAPAAGLPTPAPASTAAAPPASVIADPHGSEPPSNALAPPSAVPPSTAPPSSAPTGGLLIPVQGVQATQLLDTFTQARGQNRVHDAIDIMAPHGTPVLAVADGKVVKLFNSKAGGITLYQFDPGERFVYYYAHLQDYAPGIVEGKVLRKGELIGHVGSTGNANPEGPHLHFAIGELGADKKWWDYKAINPYPLLGGR